MTGTARTAALVLAAAILDLALIQPNHPEAATWAAFRLFPLELPVILLLLIALPRRVAMGFGAAVTLFLTLSVTLKAADIGFFLALGRGFNPVTDPGLLVAGFRLAAGTLGLALAGLALVAGVVIILALGWAFHWSVRRWAALQPPRAWRGVAAVLAVVSAGLATAEAGQAMRLWALPFTPPGAAFTARLAVERVLLIRATLADLADFRVAAASDPYSSGEGLFSRLKGHDVLVIFIESYGRASFDNPVYAPANDAIRKAAEATITASGLAMRSGWLASPVEGGQSWLAHATLSTGLSIANPTQYAAMLASTRRTLYGLAAEAGWRTAAVVPAIQLAWPEAGRLGFETVLDAAALGYKGKPFNWITMPDQFTLARYPSLLPTDPRPLFAQVVLLSSHAPWVPVPHLIPWEDVGDGTVFNRFVEGADSPETVWQDMDRVRTQYGLALGYSLQTVFDFAARQGPDAPLMVILGDHPAAGFVSQIGLPDVPVHVIGPPALLRDLDGWGFASGLTPAPRGPLWPMEAFRDQFIHAFSDPAG